MKKAINRAAREIMRGDLARRVPTTGRGDEVDELAGELNAMLAGLIAQERQVTDDIAHDLRTPLARLRQRLEFAHESPLGWRVQAGGRRHDRSGRRDHRHLRLAAADR